MSKRISPTMVRLLEAMAGDNGAAYIALDGTLLLTVREVKIASIATGYALVKRGFVSTDGRWTFKITTAGRAALGEATKTTGGHMPLEWVTNEPRNRDRVPHMGDFELSTADYWQWRSQFVEGDPRATATYTVSQLTSMGMVGLYRRTEIEK